MKRVALLVSSALISIAPIAGANAQVAGTYSGTSADGALIVMTVTGTTGNFEFTTVNVNMLPECTNPARQVSEGWGFFLGQTIVAGTNNFHSGNDYYDVTGSLHFPSNKTIKGTLTSVTAVFTPGHTPPNGAQFCKSPNQTFTLTLNPAPVIGPVKPGTAVVLH